MACSGRCHEGCLTDDRHGRIEGCLNFKQLMRRNRRGFKLDEIRSIINRVASCCIAFPRCRHIYRNTIRLPSLLSSLTVAIIMTARNDALIDFIGICDGKMPSLLLRTTSTGHVLDWLHIAMRLQAIRRSIGFSLLQAQCKPSWIGEEEREVESISHHIWHGDLDIACELLECMASRIEWIVDPEQRKRHLSTVLDAEN